MSPGEVPRARMRYSRSLVAFGGACGLAGLLAFFFGLETRLGYNWSAYPLKFTLTNLANALYGIGPMIAAGVPLLLVVAGIAKVADGEDGKVSTIMGILGALLLWFAISAFMFMVYFFSHIFTGTIRPDGGLVIPALLFAVGYLCVGLGMVVWGFQPTHRQSDESAKAPVNADAAPTGGLRRRAGYRKR